MSEVDVVSLQIDFALIDFINQPKIVRPMEFGEYLLITKGSIKIKLYQERRHSRPHFHVDYGSENHVASYAIDTGERLNGSLAKKYDKVVCAWVERNREALSSVWIAIQAGKSGDEFIKSLSSLD